MSASEKPTSIETVSRFELSEADSVRIVVNTAVMARPNVPGLKVATAKRAGEPGIYVWIPGYLWDGKQIVAIDETVATSGKSEEIQS